MEIERQFYLDELLRKQGNGFVKIITGLRRSGRAEYKQPSIHR